jgi:imidazolonepropionase-like amidohydrolase
VRILEKLALALPLLTLAAAAQQTLSIIHVTVIDTITGKTQPDNTVTIQGNRITGIAPSAGLVPKAGQIVDASGEYLIPGLWDMHTHVYFDSTAADGTDLVLPLFLANGITGIRDMGSKLDPVLEARDHINAHSLFGPRMVVSGPMLDGPKSTYKAVIPIATPEDGRQAVDMLKSRGADFVKVQSGVPREAYFAIAEEAKKVGIPFEGHVPDAVRASEAVAAGQVTFEPYRYLRSQFSRRRQVPHREEDGGDVPRDLRSRPGGQHHSAAGQKPHLAVPHALLGARAMAGRCDRLQPGS